MIVIDYWSYPTIFQSIISHADVPTLLRMRRTNSSVKDMVDRVLAYRHIVILIEKIDFSGTTLRLGLGTQRGTNNRNFWLSYGSAFHLHSAPTTKQSPRVEDKTWFMSESSVSYLDLFTGTQYQTWRDGVRNHTRAVDFTVTRTTTSHGGPVAKDDWLAAMWRLVASCGDLFAGVRLLRHDCPNLPPQLFPRVEHVIVRRGIEDSVGVGFAPSATRITILVDPLPGPTLALHEPPPGLYTDVTIVLMPLPPTHDTANELEKECAGYQGMEGWEQYRKRRLDGFVRSMMGKLVLLETKNITIVNLDHAFDPLAAPHPRQQRSAHITTTTTYGTHGDPATTARPVTATTTSTTKAAEQQDLCDQIAKAIRNVVHGLGDGKHCGRSLTFKSMDEYSTNSLEHNLATTWSLRLGVFANISLEITYHS